MPEQDWERLGALSDKVRVSGVAVSREGFGLVASVVEPAVGTLLERMRGRRAELHRVTAQGLAEVYEGAGWLQALDCHGSLCVAVSAALKPGRPGPDYHLLVSEDAGRTWHARGATMDVRSVGQVLAVGPAEFWVLGGACLCRTVDGGATWREVPLGGERSPAVERLRRVDGGVAVVGRGLAVTADGGTTWTREPAGGTRVYDADGRWVVARGEGSARVGERQEGKVRWREALPEGREPLRLAASEGLLRVLSRGAVASRSPDLALHTSEDGGGTWSSLPLAFGLHVDLADRYGLGADAWGHLLGRLAAGPSQDSLDGTGAPA